MLKPLKLKFESKILFCSDFHLNHNKEFLYKKRGFSSIKEHDEWIKSSWHDIVDSETIVFNLGDQTFNDGNGEIFEDLSKWPCKKHYCLYGNHLSGYRQNYKKALDLKFGISDGEFYPLDYNQITFLGANCMIQYGKQFIFCSHFAPRIWDGMSGGKNLPPVISLSGHSHSSDLERLPFHFTGKALDVGIEVSKKYNETPFFSIKEVISIMNNKSVDTCDHHDNNTSYSLN